MVRIGALNKLVTIEACTFTDDGSGGVDETWSSIGNIWANIKTNARLIDALEQGKGVLKSGYTITVRYPEYNPQVKTRVVYEGIIYNIVGFTELFISDKSRYWTIQAVKTIES